MANPPKSASRVSREVGRQSSTARSSVRGRYREEGRPGSRVRANAEYNGAIALCPEKPRGDVQYQTAIKNFEIGVRAFHKQNYEKAAEIFEKLVENDARDVAERAHVHLRLCRRRTGRPAPLPKSADDYYTLGVGCLNAREFGLAVEHLTKADKMKPHQDHIHYALAVSYSLMGNPDAAIAHLEAAFTLRPENRIHARRDEDFQGLASDPRFRHLLHTAGT